MTSRLPAAKSIIVVFIIRHGKVAVKRKNWGQSEENRIFLAASASGLKLFHETIGKLEFTGKTAVGMSSTRTLSRQM